MSGKPLSYWIWLVLRVISYLALAIVIGSFAMLVILTETGACSSITSGGVSCSSEFYKEMAGFGLGMVLLTVFTGIPALFAMAGVVFLLYDLFAWRRRCRSTAEITEPASATPGRDHKPRQSGFGMFLLKAFGILMAAVFLFGAVSAIISGG